MSGRPITGAEDELRRRVRMAFSRRLRAAMAARGLGQNEVSRLSGVAVAHVNGLCNGKRMPTLLTLLRLRAGLGCTWEELVGR